MPNVIGTFVPISALSSSNQQKTDWGTFETGKIFLNWLKRTNQTAWQMLPLHETQLEPGESGRRVSSPYKSYGIGLSPQYLCSTFRERVPSKEELHIFLKKHRDWIYDYAFFCALRDHFQTDDWRRWGHHLAERHKDALEYWNNKLADQIQQHILVQWQLHESFAALREEAHELGIALIGDLPFYLPVQSSLVWRYRHYFQLEPDGSMQIVSGVPNTLGAHFGRQLWGHPLYRWETQRQQNKLEEFWKIRLEYLVTLFDFVRFDHAKAFFSYGVMDTEDETKDRYEQGPGLHLFDDLIRFCQDKKLQIFAEDSGENVGGLRDSLKKLKVPGIKILRFALDEKKGKVNKEYVAVADYPQDTVAYTTTHDTETLLGYLGLLTTEQKRVLAASSGVAYDPDDIALAKRLRSAVLSSSARMVILPIQDWLLTKDRINTPGTEIPVNDPNWQFKLDIPIEKLPILSSRP